MLQPVEEIIGKCLLVVMGTFSHIWYARYCSYNHKYCPYLNVENWICGVFDLMGVFKEFKNLDFCSKNWILDENFDFIQMVSALQRPHYLLILGEN